MDTLEQRVKPAPTKQTSWWRRAKIVILVFSFLGLGSLNVATLLNDQLHVAGYNALTSILGSALTDATLTRLLSHSTVAKRKSDVAIATKNLLDEKNALMASNRNISGMHAALERTYKEVSDRHIKLQNTASKQAAVVSGVSKRIATRSAIGASRNVASLPGEALPLLGTALVVGVTAWDIHDLCLTIKDLNEINNAFGHPVEDEKAICGMKVPSKEQVISDSKRNWQSAYKVAADSINQVGNAMVAPTPPNLSWSEMKTVVCPVVAGAAGLALCQ